MRSRWGFGIVRGTEWSEGRGLFEALCELATEASGAPFEPFPASSYRELMEALADGEVGLAWMPPVPTIELQSNGLASPLAIPAREGRTSYHSALIVRRGGPKTLEELKGRRAAWVDRDSAAGYLVPRMQLAARGFDVLRFFARELFVHAHARVVDAVVGGDADVGATYCNVDPSSGRVDRSAWIDESGKATRPIDVLATMGPIPNDALVASAQLPAAARSGLARWLLALDVRGKNAFTRLLGASDFRVPAPDHYDALKHALRAARARGHDALPPESRMRMRVGR